MYPERTRASLAPATAEPAASPILAWALYAFVASLPFEYPNRIFPVETTTLSGALFLLVAVCQPHVCFRRPPLPVWLFVGYLYVIGLAFVVTGAEYPGETAKIIATRFQLILILLAGYNLMRDPLVARRALITLGLACAVLAVLTLSGVVTPEFGPRRVTALGQNPNRAAVILGGGLIALAGLAYGGARPPLRPRLLVLLACGVIGAALLKTGSRGGILALAVGLCALAVGGRGVGVRIRNVVVALVGIGALTWAVLASPLMRHRLELAQGGNLAGREEIFPLAWGQFLDRPWLGWSAAGNSYELAMRISDGEHISRDSHNLVLDLLTSTGLVGTIPFLVAFALCVLAAWRSRHGPLGVVPLALFATLLVANMSGNYVVLKLLWFTFAIALATRSPVPPPALRNPVDAHPPLWRGAGYGTAGRGWRAR